MRPLVLLLQAFLLFLATPLLAGEITIVRDNHGMPHVYGANNEDVFFGFGYIMAKDRLFQMEMRRRQALGKTAEILGAGDQKRPDKFIANDRDARTNINVQELLEEIERLPLSDRGLVESFTGGVNKAISEMLATPGLLPVQFKEFGFLPRAWTSLDSMAVAVDVLGAYSSFTTQLTNLKLYEYLRQKYPQDCDDVFNQLLWLEDPNTPTTLLDHDRGGQVKQPRLGCSEKPANGLRVGDGSKQLSQVELKEAEPRRASMAWIAGKARAEGYQSIFLNGPQAGWHSPSYYYPVALHGGDFDVIGFAAEGSFVLEIGTNPRFSWGLTAGLSTHMQVYQEALVGNKYQYKDQQLDFDQRTEVIKVKGASDDVLVISSTVHGPVVGRNDKLGVVYTQKLSWKGLAARSAMAWVNAAKTQDRDSWIGHARDFAFNYNWFYADRDGYAGFVHTGVHPEYKSGHDRRLPASGTGDYEWLGRLPADKNPMLMTQGLVINFNNKPTKDWPNSGLYWEQWSEANQTNVIIDAVIGQDKLSWTDMWAVNRIASYKDVSVEYFKPFLRKLLRNDKLSDRSRMAIELILKWDGMRTDDDRDGRFDQPGQTLFDAWLPAMVHTTLEPILKGFPAARAWLGAGYQTQQPRLEEHPSAGTQVVYQALLAKEGRSGVPHYYDFFGGKPHEEVMVEAMEKALDGLAKKYQGSMSEWKAATVEQMFFDSNVGRIPMTLPGLSFTLPLFANRGVMNLLVAYGESGERRVAYVNPPGQQGNIPLGAKVQELPLLTSHLGLYRDHRVALARLTKEEVMDNMSQLPEAVITITTKDPNKSNL